MSFYVADDAASVYSDSSSLFRDSMRSASSYSYSVPPPYSTTPPTPRDVIVHLSQPPPMPQLPPTASDQRSPIPHPHQQHHRSTNTPILPPFDPAQAFQNLDIFNVPSVTPIVNSTASTSTGILTSDDANTLIPPPTISSVGRPRGYSASHAALMGGVTLGTITRTPRPGQNLPPSLTIAQAAPQIPPVPSLPSTLRNTTSPEEVSALTSAPTSQSATSPRGRPLPPPPSRSSSDSPYPPTFSQSPDTVSNPYFSDKPVPRPPLIAQQKSGSRDDRLPTIRPLFDGRKAPIRSQKATDHRVVAGRDRERAASAPSGIPYDQAVEEELAKEGERRERGKNQITNNFLDFSDDEGGGGEDAVEVLKGVGDVGNLRRVQKTIRKNPRTVSSASDPVPSVFSMIPGSSSSYIGQLNSQVKIEDDDTDDDLDGPGKERAVHVRRQKKLQALLGADVLTNVQTKSLSPTTPGSNPSSMSISGPIGVLSAEEKARLVKRNKKLQNLLGNLPSDLNSLSISPPPRSSISADNSPIHSYNSNPLPPQPSTPPGDRMDRSIVATFRKYRRPSEVDIIQFQQQVCIERPSSEASSSHSNIPPQPGTMPGSSALGSMGSNGGTYSSSRDSTEVLIDLSARGRKKRDATSQALSFRERDKEREMKTAQLKKVNPAKVKKAKSHAELPKNATQLYNMLS